ncbi:MAG: flagellar motor protein MotB [Candidatus Magnetominusculus sp. LBB02]|nr:flagellar motor protein MotB [Candidatus Magnetominusculus sp. LBB02]
MSDLYKKIAEQSHPQAEDNLWLITMTDLMSLLLVCFLMFFVMTKRQENIASKAQQQAAAAKSQTIDSKQMEAPATVANAPTAAPENNVTAAAEIQGQPAESQIIDREATSVDSTALENAQQADGPAVDQLKSLPVTNPAAELEAVVRKQLLENDITVDSAENGIVITMRERVSFKPGSADILKNTAPVLDKVAEMIKRHPSYVLEIDGHTDNSPIHSAQYPSNWELSTARATSVLQYFINVSGIDTSGFTVKGNGDSLPIAPNDTLQHRGQNRRVEIRIKEKTS